MKLIKKKKTGLALFGGLRGCTVRREISRSEKLGSLKSVLKEVKIGLVWTFCQASKHLSAQADSQIMRLKYYYFYCHHFSSLVNSKNVSGSSWQNECVWLSNTIQINDVGLFWTWSEHPLITFIPLVSPSVQLPVVGTDVCLYSDGTRVTEEYFHTLSDNTELVLVPRGQTWSGGGKNTPVRPSAQCAHFPNNTCAF